MTPRMHRPRRQELPRLASVGPHRARSLFPVSPIPFFPFLFFFSRSFSFTVVRCRPRGFDGPRGGFPGRRGPTEGASHARLGHEPRPSDLLKISIALVHRPPRPPPLTHDVRPKQAHHRRHSPPTHCAPVFLSFFSWRGVEGPSPAQVKDTRRAKIPSRARTSS